jgi:hypothetical protein
VCYHVCKCSGFGHAQQSRIRRDLASGIMRQQAKYVRVQASVNTDPPGH